jgi:hypothetical protein
VNRQLIGQESLDNNQETFGKVNTLSYLNNQVEKKNLDQHKKQSEPVNSNKGPNVNKLVLNSPLVPQVTYERIKCRKSAHVNSNTKLCVNDF